jgi:hypothetical protein
MNRPILRGVAAAVVAAVVLAACGGDGESGGSPATTATQRSELVAQVASYDLVQDRAQRFIVGLLDNGSQELIGYGTVGLSFSYLGPRDAPRSTPAAGPSTEADYRLVPGEGTSTNTSGPRRISTSEGRGVYGADGVTFDDAGMWQVTVSARVDGDEREATAAFEVLADSTIPAVGDDAPRTRNHLPGAEGAPPKAVDSRAEDDGTVPDPVLHAGTVADAIAAGRPVMVVVSTPVFCVSRFCGPITDTVAGLAAEHGERMAFVHLEVWRDFEGKALNAGAAEWIYPTRTEDATEPWVFVVGRDGRITHRFDNVATEAELRAAIAEVTA